MAGLASMICTNTRLKSENGWRSPTMTMFLWVDLAIQLWFTILECLFLVVGMGMIPWMTSTSSPLPPASGTVCQAAAMFLLLVTVIVQSSMAVVCLYLVALTTGRHALPIFASSTST